MSDDIVKVETVQLGTLTVEPTSIVARATIIATELAKIINDRNLYSVIGKKKFVQVEGWETLGAMLGVIPREVTGGTIRHEDGTYEAIVELVRVGDGAIIGRGSAICGMDEPNWANRLEYARRSMAITRATGKAFRLAFSWIMSLAGYEPTPAEEMDGVTDAEYREVKPGKKAPPKKKAEPEPVTNGRPYPPEVVRKGLAEHAAKYKPFLPSPNQQNLLRHALELCFVGEDDVEDKRHTLLEYLTDNSSTKECSGQLWKAIIEDWLKAKQASGDGGEYSVDPVSIQEAQAIVAAA